MIISELESDCLSEGAGEKYRFADYRYREGNLKIECSLPGWCGSVGLEPLHTPGGCQFSSRSRHMPGLGRQLTSLTDVSVSPSPFFSL